jgi:hypothetical protein
MPCHNCGVLLPLQSIEVDHQNPQAGGRFVLKIFRIIGLTTQGPIGAKGVAYVFNQRHNQGKGFKIESIYPNYRELGSASYLTEASRNTGFDTTPSAKWTTTVQRSLLLSAFAFAGALNDLNRFCMNSVLNLVPLCRGCNGAKGNIQRTVA